VTGQKRGPKELAARDWVFGSRPRRLLVAKVVAANPPAAGWSKTDLAKIAGVSANGGVDDHVEALTLLGLLVAQDRRLYAPAELAEALEKLMKLLEPLSDKEPLKRRA
jgi:hypothetical protein